MNPRSLDQIASLLKFPFVVRIIDRISLASHLLNNGKYRVVAWSICNVNHLLYRYRLSSWGIEVLTSMDGFLFDPLLISKIHRVLIVLSTVMPLRDLKIQRQGQFSLAHEIGRDRRFDEFAGENILEISVYLASPYHLSQTRAYPA